MSRRVKKKKTKKIPSAKKVEKSQEVDTNLYDHLRPENKEVQVATASSGVSPTFIGGIVVTVILVGLLLSGAFTGDIQFGSNDNRGSSNDIIINPDVEIFTELCVNLFTASVHYHFGVTVYNLNQQQQFIPTNIGFEDDSCTKGMHTHDDKGFVHVEYSSSYNGVQATVSDFFTIWGKDLSQIKLLDDAGLVTIEVNGQILDINPASYTPSTQIEDEIVLRILSP